MTLSADAREPFRQPFRNGGSVSDEGAAPDLAIRHGLERWLKGLSDRNPNVDAQLVTKSSPAGCLPHRGSVTETKAQQGGQMDLFARSDLREARPSEGIGPDTEGAHMARTNPFDPHAHATSCDLSTDLQMEVGPNG